MGQYCELIGAFKERGLTLTFEKNIFTVENSLELSDKIKNIVKEIVLSKSYEYIPSENRFSGKIVFTIKPFPKPAAFDKVEFKESRLTKEALLASIHSTPSRPLTEGIIAFQNLVSMTASRVSHSIVEFAENNTESGHVLDLGCGSGVNSIPLLKKGWKVTGLDRNKTILDVFLKNARDCSGLELVHKDIREYNFTPNTYDLVVMVNVINYLAPKTIVELMMKINNTLKTNGILIGNICFEDQSNAIIMVNKLMGTHFYKKEVAAALLVHSGFEIIECRLQHEGGVEPFLIEFSARKK